MLRSNKCVQCLLAFFILVFNTAGAASETALRYRGLYTYGHEVNTFCPNISSQCYWLSPATSEQLRQQLIQLVDNNTTRPYQPICVLIQGTIDRETKSDGYAADYDGLIEVDKIFGLCHQTNIVTQGDLQHHRWVLDSINGVAVDAGQQGGNVFDLDFGEQMTLTANMGCYKLAGHAVLRDQYFMLKLTQSTHEPCAAEVQHDASLIETVLTHESTITLDTKYLLLQNEATLLKYKLQDWLH